MPLSLRPFTRLAGFALSLLLACSAPVVWAQSPSSPQAKPFYLDLNHQQLNLQGRNFCVEQVVDGRAGQTAIGVINHGFNNKPTAVLFRKGMQPELTTWLQQQLPPRPTDHNVVLCVRQLRVGEVISGLNRAPAATADLVADIYERRPDGYHFVCNVADRISSRGVSIDSDHLYHLVALLEHCLAQVTKANWDLAGKRPARTLAQAAAEHPQAGKPAIFRAAVPRRGVYYTVEDFLANRPDTTAALELDTLRAGAIGTGAASEWVGTVVLRAKVRTADGDRVGKKDVWGFSDGRQAFVRQINTYRPLTQQADFFTFVGAATLDVEAANRRSKKFIERSIIGLNFSSTGPDNTGQPMVYGLDSRTGLVAPLLTPGQPLRHDTAFVYVYRPLGGPPESQRLLLNDREVGYLRPGQYLELEWPHFGRPMRLTLESAAGPALLLAPSAARANYVRLVPNAPTSPWQWMPARQGEAEVDALEKQRAR